MTRLYRFVARYGNRLRRPVVASIFVIPTKIEIETLGIRVLYYILLSLRSAIACWTGLADKLHNAEITKMKKLLEEAKKGEEKWGC